MRLLRPRRPRLRRRRRLPASSPSPSSPSSSSASATAAARPGRTHDGGQVGGLEDHRGDGARLQEERGGCGRLLGSGSVRRLLLAAAACFGGGSARWPGVSAVQRQGPPRRRRPRRLVLPATAALRRRGGGLGAAGAAADRLLDRRLGGRCGRRLCGVGPRAPLPRLRHGEGRQGFGRFGHLAGAGAACGRLGLGFGGLGCGDGDLLRGRSAGSCCRPRPAASAAASAASFFGSALRRVRTGRFGGVATAASADSAASLVTAASSLPVTTWSLSICGDTPAPDVPPHPAPVGANICQHPQALTEVNWIPSGSHRQWGAAALEGRRNCSETR